jgi:hypothetical protein
MAKPAVTFISQTDARTVWKVQMPGTAANPGKAYRVTQYEDGGTLMIESFETKRLISRNAVHLRQQIDVAMAPHL